MSGTGERIDKYFAAKKMSRSSRSLAAMDTESKQALRATRATPSWFRVTQNMAGEKKRVKSESVRTKRKSGPMTNQMLTNIMCPIFSYKRIGFGNNWATRSHNHLTTDYPSRQGTVKSLNWASNEQDWKEFIGLPMHNWGNQTPSAGQYFTYDGFHCAVSQLIGKANDVRNDVQNTYFSRGTGTNTLINTTSDALDNSTRVVNWNGMVFDYLGGYQEHTFTNNSECNITIFLCECRPREVMTGVEEDLASAGNNWKVRSIGEDLLLDYKNDLPLGNNVLPTYVADASGRNVTTNSINDVCVRINSHSNIVHRRWMVGKEIRVVLKPGDGYTHRMNFDPFSFTESTFNSLTSQLSDLTSTNPNDANSTPPVMLIPMFTKVLVVRAKSEMGFEATSGYISNVGTLPGACSHVCTEKHTCRMLPVQKPFQTFVDYTLSGTVNRVMEGQSSANVDILAATGLADV